MTYPTQNLLTIIIFQPVQNNGSRNIWMKTYYQFNAAYSYSPVHSYRSACNKPQTSWASLGQLLASLGQSLATHWPLATSRVCISVPEQFLSQPWWRCNSTPDRHKLPPVTSHIPGDIHSINTAWWRKKFPYICHTKFPQEMCELAQLKGCGWFVELTWLSLWVCAAFCRVRHGEIIRSIITIIHWRSDIQYYSQI